MALPSPVEYERKLAARRKRMMADRAKTKKTVERLTAISESSPGALLDGMLAHIQRIGEIEEHLDAYTESLVNQAAENARFADEIPGQISVRIQENVGKPLTDLRDGVQASTAGIRDALMTLNAQINALASRPQERPPEVDLTGIQADLRTLISRPIFEPYEPEYTEIARQPTEFKFSVDTRDKQGDIQDVTVKVTRYE